MPAASTIELVTTSTVLDVTIDSRWLARRRSRAAD
jgi:hypothetical protein